MFGAAHDQGRPLRSVDDRAEARQPSRLDRAGRHPATRYGMARAHHHRTSPLPHDTTADAPEAVDDLLNEGRVRTELCGRTLITDVGANEEGPSDSRGLADPRGSVPGGGGGIELDQRTRSASKEISEVGPTTCSDLVCSHRIAPPLTEVWARCGQNASRSRRTVRHDERGESPGSGPSTSMKMVDTSFASVTLPTRPATVDRSASSSGSSMWSSRALVAT